MLNLIKSPKILQYLFADFLWKINTNEKVIFLTFDDGPHPIITPWIIDLMNQYKKFRGEEPNVSSLLRKRGLN